MRKSLATGIAFSLFWNILAFEKPSFADDNFCTHGTTWITESGKSLQPTVRLQADFDGDGKIDFLCKDVRQHPSNGNRLLMWLILGNGQKPYWAEWDEWCTHKNSKVSIGQRGKRNILVCDDLSNHWERVIP